MTRHDQPALPPVTDTQRRAAFVLLGIRGQTFEQAMRDAANRRLIDACAAGIRNKELARRAALKASTAKHTGART